MKYSFNKLDAVTFIEEIIDGSRRSTSISYDADQRVTSIRKGSVTETYTYDGYSRVTEKVTTLSGETRLTERYTYRTVDDAPTTQVASHQIITDVRDITYSYTYDDNGNILTVTETSTPPGSLLSTSTTTSYVYDSQNQLLRENNEAAGKTWTWTYDNAGNILSHGEYAYTTGELGTALDTVDYGYTAAVWGDLLCTYDGVSLGGDMLGNLTQIGNRRYVWKHGRELSQVVESGTIWTYTYNADGLRTRRTDGTTNYQYIYADGQLVKQRIGSSNMSFSYDAGGTPMSVYYNGANYYYVTNLQGDVIAITNDAGAAVVSYTYDAWGKILSITGTMADTLGKYNPLRYRGYVYDRETELYYLQSRYYDPEMGRFISPDVFASTGQGFVGNNMFAYCLNNPVTYCDPTGHFGLVAAIIVTGAIVGGALGAFSAATTGGNVLESAIKGCITGAIGSACGLLIANPIVAVGVATIGGASVELASQVTKQYVETNTVDMSKVDVGNVLKTGIQTGMGTAIPAFGGGASNAVDAFGTALIWAEGSALITCADIAITNTISAVQSSTGNVSPASSGSVSSYRQRLELYERKMHGL